MKKRGTANTNEFGLTKGEDYIIETIDFGSSYIYDLDGNYLMYCRTDSFDNIMPIL